MKQLITFLLCLFTLFAEAQVNPNDTNKYFKSYDYGFSYKRLQARDAFIFPTDTVINKLGAVSLNGVIYLGNGTKWTSIGSGSSSIDTTSLSNRINLKIDSLKRSNDSVYAYRNGIRFFQFKDSVGSGGGDFWKTSDTTNLTDTTIIRSDYVIQFNGIEGEIKKFNVFAENILFSTTENKISLVGLSSSTDTSTYKPLGIDNTGKLAPLTSWISGGSSIDTTNQFVNSVESLNDSSIRVIKGTTTTDITIKSVANSINAKRLVTQVYNNSGVTISRGAVVYINGRHSSNYPTILPAQANNENNSYKTFALVQDNIADKSIGYVIQSGTITGLNLPTSTYTDGDIVYLSPTTLGGITNIKPSASNHICKLGSVTRAHPTLGSIEIKIENGWQLDELSDVKIAPVPNDSTLLQFSRVDSLWHDVSVTNAIGTKYIKPSDTTSMLSNYSTRINGKLNISDTSSLSNRINLKLNIADTASMLSFYARTNVVNASLANKLNATDVNTALSAYQYLGSTLKVFPIGVTSINQSVLGLTNVDKRITFVAVYSQTTQTITGVKYGVTSIGTSFVANASYNGFALYSINTSTGLLTRIDSTANDGTIYSTGGWLSKAFVTPISLTGGVVYYMAYIVNGSATTYPSIAQAAQQLLPTAFDFPNNIKLTGYLTNFSSFPSTVNISTFTTNTNYPLLMLY